MALLHGDAEGPAAEVAAHHASGRGHHAGKTRSPRIGLIRHFEVVHGFPGPGWLSVDDLAAWMAAYEASDVLHKPVDLGPLPWRHCIASTAQRAMTTARALYPGPIETTPQLCEPRLRPFRTGRLRMPFAGWRMLLRLAWFSSHPSQLDVKRTFLSDIEAIAERLANVSDDTLVVSHAGAMMFLRAALLRRGFRGPRFGIAECGRLYVFSRGR